MTQHNPDSTLFPHQATSLAPGQREDPWSAFPIVEHAAATARAGSDPWAGYPIVSDGQPSTSEAAPGQLSTWSDVAGDVGKSIGAGLVHGVAGLAGMPKAASDLLVAGVDRVHQYVAGETDEERRARVASRDSGAMFKGIGDAISADGITRAIEDNITGPLHVPQTTAGNFAHTAAEFVPGGAIGRIANVGRNALAFGIVPGIASEGAGQAFKGTAAEPIARVAGALVGGVGSAGAMRLGSADRLVQNATRGVQPAELDAAENLFLTAQRQGTPISRAEALQSVTQGRTQIGDLQHTVEGMGGMRDFYAARPQQTTTAARRAFDDVSPAVADPSSIGPDIGRSGERIIGDVEGAINRATRPLYQQAEQGLLSPAEFTAVSRDPVFQEGLRRVRNDPWIGPTLEGHPDNSVAVIDAIKKQLDETSRNLRDPLSGTARSNYSASIVDRGRDHAVTAADRATGSVNGTPGVYESARAIQSGARERFLQPLQNGPLGSIAKKDLTTREAINALFPTKPLPNSADDISTAMTALASKNPTAARMLVRVHAESIFDDAARRLATGGPSQTTGAKFAAALRGNPQQAANLEAAVRALPNGDQIWPGFNRFLDVMEAQQFRQATGSRTAFKGPAVQELGRGGIANDTAQIVATGGIKLPAKIFEAMKNWNVGRNTDQLSYLLTSPEAAQRFRQIVSAPLGSNKATALAARLTHLALEAPRQPLRITVNKASAPE